MLPHPALSDDIAGEGVQLLNECLMRYKYPSNITLDRARNKQNQKRILLTKVFAELFSKSDRVPPRHTNNSELTLNQSNNKNSNETKAAIHFRIRKTALTANEPPTATAAISR